VTGEERLNEIRSTLEARMEEFESKDWRTFS